MTNNLFSSDLWLPALERYGSDTRLSVKLFDADERVVFGPIHPTPLFQLFEDKGYDPGIFAECARRCLAQTDSRPAVMVSEIYGLAAVGTSLVLAGKIVGAAVGGYAFVDFSQLSEVQRLAKDAGIKFERLWEIARAQKPVPQQRLMLNGELLQVLGDALLRENYRTRLYEDAVLKLQQTAAEKEQAHQELQEFAAALRANQEQLAKELEATRELQSASTLLVKRGNSLVVYQRIVDAAVAIMRSDFASLQMFHPERGSGGELHLMAHHGFTAESAGFWEWVRPASKCACGLALQSGKRAIVEDVETCDFTGGEDDLKAYRELGIRTIQSTPLLSRDGRLLGMISTHWRAPCVPSEADLRVFDVLARQAADLLELNQSVMATASLAAIVEFSDDAIISKDLNGIITSWNRGAERLFGYTPQEAIGQSVTILTPSSRIEEGESILDRIRRGESIEHYETVRRRKDGTELDISLTVSPIRDSQGRITSASTIARDITERKQSEAALRRAEKLASAGQMAATIAHEINNPLQAVTHLWYLLNQNALPAAARDQLQMLGKELDRIVHITRQTLEFYRSDSKPASTDLKEPIENAIKLLAPKTESRGARIETDYRTSATVNAYAGELRQVFSNLIINALEAGATYIKVRVSPAVDIRRAPRRGVRVMFADNGAGIPADAKPKVFEPFVTTKADKGTGLGLWVTKGIIQKHEGWIRLLSSTNGCRRGTSFCIFLPEANKRPSNSLRDSGNAA